MDLSYIHLTVSLEHVYSVHLVYLATIIRRVYYKHEIIFLQLMFFMDTISVRDVRNVWQSR
jgi:hypothetical protein